MIRIDKLESGYVTLTMDYAAVSNLANALYALNKSNSEYKAKKEEIELMVVKDMTKGMIDPYTVVKLTEYYIEKGIMPYKKDLIKKVMNYDKRTSKEKS